MENNKENRCNSSYWNSAVLLEYHDNRWCKPEHNDNEIYAMLCLEIFGVGLNWKIILEKEHNLRVAFDNFPPNIVAHYNKSKIKELIGNSNIIRNIRTIKATINNANIFINIQKEFGSFDKYIWNFTDNKIMYHNIENDKYIPTRNELSDIIYKNMKQRGFNFIASIIIYSFLQGIRIINNHYKNCDYGQY